jgi:hypothetical protein
MQQIGAPTTDESDVRDTSVVPWTCQWLRVGVVTGAIPSTSPGLCTCTCTCTSSIAHSSLPCVLSLPY